MAKTFSKSGITTGNTVEAWHVTQSIDAFNGTEAYDINLSGSFNMTGPINGQSGLINPLTASFAISSSNAFSASNALTASYVVSASNALTASFAPNIFNSNGTITSNRTASLGSNTLSFDGTNSNIIFTPNNAGGYLQLEGKASGVPRFSVSIPAYAPLNKPIAGFQLGVRAWDDVTYPGYGEIGDAFFYAGNATNGLNFLNPVGTGTEDYIRFYAGELATAISHIHIQGTGSTKGYVGIGTELPTEKLHISSGDMLVENTNGKYYTDIQNATGPLTILSGDSSGVSRIGVIVPTYDSITLGIRGASAVFPGYGKQGDAFIYSSNANNGFNLISSPGTGTDDYIRFYAGQDANGTIPDIHIQGTGSTKGYIGIGKETPNTKLDINGNTTITGSLTVSSETRFTSTKSFSSGGGTLNADNATRISLIINGTTTTTLSDGTDGQIIYLYCIFEF